MIKNKYKKYEFNLKAWNTTTGHSSSRNSKIKERRQERNHSSRYDVQAFRKSTQEFST